MKKNTCRLECCTCILKTNCTMRLWMLLWLTSKLLSYFLLSCEEIENTNCKLNHDINNAVLLFFSVLLTTLSGRGEIMYYYYCRCVAVNLWFTVACSWWFRPDLTIYSFYIYIITYLFKYFNGCSKLFEDQISILIG